MKTGACSSLRQSLLIPGLVMLDVNLNWQQTLHKDTSEHQSAPTFAMEFSFHIIKTL